MDFNAIASQAIAILIPILSAAKEGALNGIKSDAWEFIKSIFKRKKDDEKIADDMEKNPGDGKLQGKAELRLAQLLEENPGLAEQLQEYINKELAKGNVKNMIKITTYEKSIEAKDIANNGIIVLGDNAHINTAPEPPKKP